MNVGRSLSIGSSLVFLLLVAGTSSAQRIGGPDAGGDANLTRFEARLVCVDCTLDEARKMESKDAEQVARKENDNLYELQGDNERLVIDIHWNNNIDHTAWNNLVGLSHQVWLRAKDNALQRLTNNENVGKNLIITGALHKSRTFDVAQVTLPQ